MLILTVKLILAHLMGDFLFQRTSWVEDKQAKKLKSKYLYWHILIHAGILLLILRFDFSYWLGMITIVVSHFVIDAAKVLSSRKVNSRIAFFLDQALHLLVIVGVVYYYTPFKVNLDFIYSIQTLLFITFIILCTKVSSIVMKVIISKWEPENRNNKSLEKAGSFIGILERLFVFSFILLDYWAGIGFLLAAKSVFRFGDLSKGDDRKLTEYILIGTLLSFGLAMLNALGFKFLLELSSKF
jgi:hypothetical protein